MFKGHSHLIKKVGSFPNIYFRSTTVLFFFFFTSAITSKTDAENQGNHKMRAPSVHIFKYHNPKEMPQ